MTKSLKKTTLWNLIFQYYSIFYSISLGLLLVPLYLEFIPLNIYGAWLVTGNLVQWLTCLDPGVSDVLKINVLESYAKKEMSKLSDLLFSSLAILFSISLIVFLFGFVLSFFLKYFIGGQDLSSFSVILKSFYFSIIGSSLLIFSFGLSNFNQGMLSSLAVGVIYMISTIVSLVISVLLLKNNYGLVSIPLGQIICALLLIFGNSVYIIYRFKSESIPVFYSFNNLKKMLSLSTLNFLGKVGSQIANQIDALYTSHFLGTNVTTIYILNKKGPEISRTFIERPSLAFLPSITTLWHSKNYDKLNFYIIRLFKISIWLLGIVFIGFILSNKYFITIWVGPNFYATATTNFFICLNLIILALNNIFTNLYFSLGNIKISSWYTFLQSIISAIFLYVGVKYYGINGLLIFQFISHFIFTAWVLPVKVFRILRIPFNITKSIFKEVFFVAFTCIFLFLIFRNQIIKQSWFYFIIYISKIFFSYTLFIAILSKSFRFEIKNFYNIIFKLKND